MTPDPDRPSANGSSREPQTPLPERYRYKPMAAAYQGAMESVFAIVGCTGAGYWADGYFGTSPWLLVGGATIGFAAFVLRLTRLGSALNQADSTQEPPKPGKNPGRPPDSAASSTKPSHD